MHLAFMKKVRFFSEFVTLRVLLKANYQKKKKTQRKVELIFDLTEESNFFHHSAFKTQSYVLNESV